MTPSPEGWPTKAKEALSPHQGRLTLLDTNTIFLMSWGYQMTYLNTWVKMTYLNTWVTSLSLFSYLQEIIWAITESLTFWGNFFWVSKPVIGLWFCLDLALVLLKQNDFQYRAHQTLANNFVITTCLNKWISVKNQSTLSFIIVILCENWKTIFLHSL